MLGLQSRATIIKTRYNENKGKAMKIAVAGSSGLIGAALCSALVAGGHQVIRLVRNDTHAPLIGTQVLWDPEKGELLERDLAGCDAVINLAGETIMGRWNGAKKQRLRRSRIIPTQLLVKKMTALESPPKVFLNASATGFYGARGDEILFETSVPPAGFLAEICAEWERALEPAMNKGIRCIATRFGAVLSLHGGALQNMLPAFKLGLGGKIGPGTQHMSWIAIDDAINAMIYVLSNSTCEGAFNFVTPNAVTNAELTHILGKLLRRPTLFSMPAFMARLVFGAVADELLLADVAVQPHKLLAAGYQFLYPDLEGALRHLLTNSTKSY